MWQPLAIAGGAAATRPSIRVSAPNEARWMCLAWCALGGSRVRLSAWINPVERKQGDTLMGLLNAMFGKKLGEAKANLKKIENKDLMEAVVASCILIAYADGDCEE